MYSQVCLSHYAHIYSGIYVCKVSKRIRLSLSEDDDDATFFKWSLLRHSPCRLQIVIYGDSLNVRLIDVRLWLKLD